MTPTQTNYSTENCGEEENCTESSIYGDLQPWAILAAVAILFLLLVVNTVSVIKRRNDHRIVERYLMSLHALFPSGRNYNEVVNEEQDPEITVISKRVRGCGTATDYDEIEMIGNHRYESNDAEECKPVKKAETEHESETELDKEMEPVCNTEERERHSTEHAQSRDSMYSLQREVLSSNL